MQNFDTSDSLEIQSAELTLIESTENARISPNIYGHFAEHLGRCVDEGLWVGEDSVIPNTRGLRNDVLSALRTLKVPVLRWPGGCFADEYHWMDGIGPRHARPRRINSHWGGVIENNHFGTHEFMDLCELIAAEPYVCGNVGSGSVQEMGQWVEYMTSNADSTMARLRRQNGRERPFELGYFGVGNESWGCGGNMRAEYYADNYRRYSTFVKNHSGNRITRIACGANGADYDWTRVLMQHARAQMNGLSLHYYTLPTDDWSKKGSATEFGEDEWNQTLLHTLRMEELVGKHSAIMDEQDPQRKIGLIVDEWGTWYDVEPGHEPGFLYQQNTLRDALVAAINLNIFNRYAARVTMANIAQMVNVLQAVILTDKERMLLTPTYHVFEMYKVHQGATSLPITLNTPRYAHGASSLPMLHASASRDDRACLHVSVANLDPRRSVRLSIPRVSGNVSARILTATKANAHNTFDQTELVKPVPFTDISVTGDALSAMLPAKSVVVLSVA